MDLAVLSLNVICSFCYVNYELFQGFDNIDSTSESTTYYDHTKVYKMTASVKIANVTVSRRENEMNYSTSTMHKKTNLTSTEELKRRLKNTKKKCPETERPLSIGTYEIPTQRDLVLFTKRTLMKMFNSYHSKMLYLLKDIKEATRSTVVLEKKCYGQSRTLFRKCVKDVSKKCVVITKDLVALLERQELEVAALTEDKICDMASMRTDPIQLIKVLAMDEAASDFALPAFLRLLGACSVHCHAPSSTPDRRPRLRQMTDQDLVVRHFLTSKNYIQLLNDTNKYV